VATRVAGASTVIDDGETGVLVPVDDFGALVEATATLVRTPEQRASMGRAARARCESTFALPAVARQWGALLHSVVNGEPLTDSATHVPSAQPPLPL
jgi:glycosyltransferase involved in cell wall biosynthesis